jgi:hypothetical protein
MIRILIRQVVDWRRRAPKSLGIADIEPMLALSACGGERSGDVHLARLYVSAGGEQKLTVNVSFIPTVTPAEDLWQYIAEALQAGLAERNKSLRRSRGEAQTG